MSEPILTRLTADEILRRVEARDRAWARWAVFWLALGGIFGVSATLLALLLFGGRG